MKCFSLLSGLFACFLFASPLLAETVTTTWGAIKKGEQPQAEGTVSLKQAVIAGTTVSFILSDGTMIPLERYEALVEAGKLRFPEAFELVLGGGETQEVPATGAGKVIPFGKLRIVTVPLATHPIGGCIKRTVPHVGFLIREVEGRLLLDIHLAKWDEGGGGKTCFGIYITRDNPINPNKTDELFCWKGCIGTDIMNPSQLKNELVRGFVAAGIPLAFAVPLMFITFPLLLAPAGL